MIVNWPSCAPVLLLLGSITGCRTEQTLTAEDLRSEIESIGSIASETTLFAKQIHERRVTPTFAREHLNYLRDQNEETLQELTNASATGPNDAILSEARIQARELSQQLTEFAQSEQDASAESLSRINQVLSESQRLQASVR